MALGSQNEISHVIARCVACCVVVIVYTDKEVKGEFELQMSLMQDQCVAVLQFIGRQPH